MFDVCSQRVDLWCENANEKVKKELEEMMEAEKEEIHYELKLNKNIIEVMT